MNKRIVLWAVLLVTGIIMILFRMNISRYISDLTALLVAGIILAAVSGIGLLLEIYRKSK